MNDKIYKLLGAAALSFFSVAAQAQDIKLGFNGDLSASPSALSGQAAVLGLQAAIGDHMGLGARLDEVEVRRLGEAWRPWRSVATCLFWQSYLHARGRTAPRLPPELCA